MTSPEIEHFLAFAEESHLNTQTHNYNCSLEGTNSNLYATLSAAYRQCDGWNRTVMVS